MDYSRRRRLSLSLSSPLSTAQHRAEFIQRGMTGRHSTYRKQPSRGPGLLRRRNILRHERWNDALFLHYTVDADELQAKLPAGLTVDNYRGTTLISIVALSECGIEPVCPMAMLAWLLQPLRGSHHSVSVRTYVRPTNGNGPPGLYFFSLDCTSWLPSVFARVFLNLPYRLAQMDRKCIVGHSFANDDSDSIPRFEIDSRRCKRTLLRCEPQAYFHAKWEPASRAQPAEPGSLDEFVVERYCIYGKRRFQRALWCGGIEHAPWPLQRANVKQLDTDILAVAGFTAARPIAAHHAACVVDVEVFSEPL